MYNQDIKNAFILQYTDNKSKLALFTSCISLFNTISNYEQEFDTDICAFSEEQLQPVAEKLMTVRSNGSKLRITILRHYSTWCIENHIPGANTNIFRMSENNDDRVKRSMVGSPLELHGYLNRVFSPVSGMESDIIYRCFFWLAYAGIEMEDIVKVESSDVHLSDMVISYGGKIYPIYREGRETIRICAEETQFVYRNPTYTEVGCIIRNRVLGTELMRGIKGKPSADSLRPALSRITRGALNSGKTNIRLTYYSTYLSGLFYRVYEQEMDGWEIDFTDVADSDMAGKEYSIKSKYPKGALTSKRNKLAKQYLKDYNQWKSIFHS